MFNHVPGETFNHLIGVIFYFFFYYFTRQHTHTKVNLI